MICIGPLVFHLPPKRPHRTATRDPGMWKEDSEDRNRRRWRARARELHSSPVRARGVGGGTKTARVEASERVKGRMKEGWRGQGPDAEDPAKEGFSGGRAEGRRRGGVGLCSGENGPQQVRWIYTSMKLRLRHNRASTSFLPLHYTCRSFSFADLLS